MAGARRKLKIVCDDGLVPHIVQKRDRMSLKTAV
jgi:hypothetical protein